MRDLYTEYLNGAADLRAFYGRFPNEVYSPAPVAAPWPAELAEAIRAYNARLANPAPFRGNEAVVVTGQQPALFTGPLYCIYKAATAVRLAERLSTATGAPCVPLFWVAGDDHDFEEVRTAHILTKTHQPRALAYTPAESVDGRPVYRVHLEESLHALIDEAAAQTRGSEFRDEIVRFLHESLDASTSLADWTARLMARLFRDTPLVLFAPHIPAARVLARDVLDKEASEPLASTVLINETGTRLADLGFSPQLVKRATECSFFLEMGERRRKVLFESGRYRLPEEDMTCSVEEMQALLAARPERFTPNVALRCIVQQRLFPVAAYVAGPGEIAYWAQLGPLFKRFGCAMPVVYPRARCVLTTRKLNTLREKLDIGVEDLERGADALVTRVLTRVARDPARETLDRGRGPIEQHLQRLVADLGKHAGPGAEMAQALQKHTSAALDRIARAIVMGDEARVAATKKQVDRLCNSLAPFRKPQERVYTVFSFLFEHGWGLIPRLLDELDIESFQTNEVEL